MAHAVASCLSWTSDRTAYAGLQLSPECQHLIHHMFRPNPEERCTIEDIMRHPWFVKDLPPQLAHINSYLLHAKVGHLLQLGCGHSASMCSGLLPPHHATVV